ncbi:4778_t:CDS:10 [Entrophospora sp. SA101]|nr:4778_t:CDS:10 [Entrophospora sp. SA101]
MALSDITPRKVNLWIKNMESIVHLTKTLSEKLNDDFLSVEWVIHRINRMNGKIENITEKEESLIRKYLSYQVSSMLIQAISAIIFRNPNKIYEIWKQFTKKSCLVTYQHKLKLSTGLPIETPIKEFGDKFVAENLFNIKVIEPDTTYNYGCSCEDNCKNNCACIDDHMEGWGVQTLENIKRGGFVTEHMGEVIDSKTALTRTICYNKLHIMPFFDLDYGFTFVVENRDLKSQRIAFFAVRDIDKMEELTIDYKMKGELILSMNDSDSALLECEWEYSIANCNYDTVLKNLYILSNILFLSVAIGGIILLFIRLVVRNSHLWDKNSGFFLPLEGYLLGISIFSGVRAFANFVQQFNLFASSPIARELIYDFSWIPADLTVATYLAGIFRALLKMYLHNFTSHQQPTKGVYLLPESHINKIYWTFFIIHFIYSPSLAIISGITCNISRFLNHSCNPNLITIPFVVENRDLKSQRIAFFAVRDIDKMEELTIDYKMKGELILSMNDSDSALLECEWEYSIANCNYDTVLKNLYILSNILFLSVAIGGIILLFIRLVVRNSHLWDKNSGFFLPLEGYLLGISIFSGVRAFANFVQQFNLFASSPIARELIYDFSWIPADLTVATYLAGIFRALLKMYLHNFTSHQQPTKAIISGITRQNNDKELLNIIFGLHWSGFGIVQLLFAASAAYYGFKLVQLTKASSLVGILQAEIYPRSYKFMDINSVQV